MPVDVYAFRAFGHVSRRGEMRGGLPSLARHCRMGLAKARESVGLLERLRMMHVEERSGQAPILTVTDPAQWLSGAAAEDAAAAYAAELEVTKAKDRARKRATRRAATPTGSDTGTPIGSDTPPGSDPSRIREGTPTGSETPPLSDPPPPPAPPYKDGGYPFGRDPLRGDAREDVDDEGVAKPLDLSFLSADTEAEHGASIRRVLAGKSATSIDWVYRETFGKAATGFGIPEVTALVREHGFERVGAALVLTAIQKGPDASLAYAKAVLRGYGTTKRSGLDAHGNTAAATAFLTGVTT